MNTCSTCKFFNGSNFCKQYSCNTKSSDTCKQYSSDNNLSENKQHLMD